MVTAADAPARASTAAQLPLTLFRGYDFRSNSLTLSPEDARFIRQKLAELASLSQVDGVGVDLHKMGLCPYGSSFFLCQYSDELETINGLKQTGNTKNFGEAHAHHFTFENSRTTAGIAAAWAMLNQLGVEGLRAYAAKLLHVNAMVAEALGEWPDDFKVLRRPESWRVPLFTLVFSAEVIATNAQVHRFHAIVTERVFKGSIGVPQIGLVPEYKMRGRPASAVLMAYPMSLFLTPAVAQAAVAALLSIKRQMSKKGVRKAPAFASAPPPR